MSTMMNIIWANFLSMYCQYVIHQEWVFVHMKEATFILTNLSQIQRKMRNRRKFEEKNTIII